MANYIPIEERLVEERDVTQALIKIKPLKHTEQDYMLALHQKTQNQSNTLDRRPEYQNPIFNHLSNQQRTNSECKKCSNHLSWGTGKIYCRFCGWWVCNECIVKERYDPQNNDIKAKICQICQELYLKNTLVHQYYMRQNIMQAVFKRLVNQQCQLEQLIDQQIKKKNQNDKKLITNGAMNVIIAVNQQKVKNDELKQQVQSLKYKLQNAQRMYNQLVIKCQSKKRKLMKGEAGVSFASEMSKVQLADDDNIQPPTAIEIDHKSQKTERNQSFVGNILDQYNKKDNKQEDADGKNSRQMCKCLMF